MPFYLVLLLSHVVTIKKEDIIEPTPIPTPNTGKRLTKIVDEYNYYSINGTEEEERELETYILDYDNQGRLVSIIEYEEEKIDEQYTIKYFKDSITCTCIEEDSREILTFKLFDGKIILKTDTYKEYGYEQSTHTSIYAYNSSNYLNEITEESGETTFTWLDNKLINLNIHYMGIYSFEGSHSFEYDEKTCEGYNPALVLLLRSKMEISGLLPFIANPELVGLKTNQLPKAIVHHSDDGEIRNLTYELDNDGYLTKCVATKKYDDGYSYTTYTFTWE